MEQRQIKGLVGSACFYLLLAGTLGWFLVQCIHDWTLTIDDAYISARYAHNLAKHFSLSWNPGLAPTEGYTNFLLVVLLAIPGVLGMSIIAAAKGIGVAAGLGIIVYLAIPGGRLVRNRWAGLMAAALFGFQGAAPAHAVSGLETLLFALLLLLLVHSCIAILQSETISRRSLKLFCLAGLAAGLTRPEGAVVAGLLMIAIVLVRFRRLDRSHYATVALWFFLPGAIYMAWRLSFFGYLFPNTFYHKVRGTTTHEANKEYFRDFATTLVTLLPLLIIPLGFRWRPLFLVPLLAIAGASAIYTISDISNMGYGGRFLYPCLPLIYFLFAAAMGEIIEGRRSLRPLNFIEVLAIAGLFTAMLNQVAAQTDFYRDWSQHYGYALKRAHVVLGRLLHSVSPNGRVTIWSDGGAIPYYSDWTAMDAVGLLDSHIAHFGFTPDYLFNFHPDAIAMTAKTTDCTDAGGGSKVNAIKGNPAWSEYARFGAFAFGSDYFQVVFGRREAFDGRLRRAIEGSPYNVDFETTGTLLRGLVKVNTEDSPLMPSVQFAFKPGDIKAGARAGLERVFHTQPGHSYRLSCLIQDNCAPADRPGLMLQQVVVGGAIADSHDLSAPAFTGWREVDYAFRAAGELTPVAIELEASAAATQPDWAALSTTQVMGLTLEEAPGP